MLLDTLKLQKGQIKWIKVAHTQNPKLMEQEGHQLHG